MDFEYLKYYLEDLPQEKRQLFFSLYDTFSGQGYSKADSAEIVKCYVDGIDSNECSKKIKVYGKGFFKWQEATNPIYHKQVVQRYHLDNDERSDDIRHKSEEDKRYLALRRAKERVLDIVLCNEWKFFCTLTLDPKEYNSSDPVFVRNKLRNWLNNMQKRRGLEYILVPEYHKLDNKIHAHLLINDCGLKLVDSGTVAIPTYKKPIQVETADKYGIPKDQRKTVYNITDWKYGWTTAMQCYGDNNLRTAIYVTKYITKDSDKIFGKYFWSSKGIYREPITVLGMSDSMWWEIYNDDESVYVPGTETKIRYGTNIGYTMGASCSDDQIALIREEAERKTEYEYFSFMPGLPAELHLEKIEAFDDSWI